MIIEKTTPDMDTRFRYSLEIHNGFPSSSPTGVAEPREVLVSFYMDYPCWCELENSPVWLALEDHVRGHQTERTHMQLLTPAEIWEAEAYSSRFGWWSRQKRCLSGGFQYVLSSIRNLFSHLRKE